MCDHVDLSHFVMNRKHYLTKFPCYFIFFLVHEILEPFKTSDFNSTFILVT